MPIAEWGNNTWLFVEGRPKAEVGHELTVEHRRVSPEYFETMRIPLLRGRFLTESDHRGTVNALLINQTLSKMYWPHQDPIGAYVTLFGFPPDRKFQVVGVVGDVRNSKEGLNASALPEVYIPFREFVTGNMSWVVRSSTDPTKLVPQLRRAVLSVDPTQPVFDIRAMSTVIQRSLVNQRLESLMVGFFAIAALLLAVVGVYGVVAYALRQRLSEMGTRMALGAEPRDLLRLVLREGLKMAAIGIGIGLAMVLVVLRTLNTRALHTDVHTVTPLLISTLLITVCTLLACLVPAWRASTLSPMVAIRNDLHPSLARLRVSYRELTGRVSALLSEEPHPLVAGTQLLAALADASRSAESFAEAIQIALKTIRDEVRASAATLLTQRAPDQPYRCTATTLEGQIEAALPLDALLLRRLRSYSSALPLSSADLAALRQWAAEHAPEHLPEIETLVTLDAALAVPVLSKTQMVGVLLLGSPVGRAEYSSVERRVLRSAAAQIALMLDNARLTDRIVQQERLTRDLELAGEVQKRLFPEKSPESAAVQLIGISIPARGVGGDYYDFLELGNKQIGVALADVAGKGIPAALVMSVVQASLRSLADQNGSSLAQLATTMNRLLHRSTGVNSYATFFYAQFDEDRRQLRYVNAGHNPPFLLRNTSNPTIEELSAGGTIIGMFPQSSYEETTLDLASGDVLMLFSDGVSEANNPNEDEFGEERLKNVLCRTAHLPIKEMAAQILQELKNWMADAAQFDDLTFVLMKVA
jgi:serine phosphatase RsbU (regulator of sigma subunit)